MNILDNRRLGKQTARLMDGLFGRWTIKLNDIGSNQTITIVRQISAVRLGNEGFVKNDRTFGAVCLNANDGCSFSARGV